MIARQCGGGGHDFDARKRYDFDWKTAKDLGQYGQGLLAALEEENGRVLIWLK